MKIQSFNETKQMMMGSLGHKNKRLFLFTGIRVGKCVKEIKDQEEEARKNQSLRTILGSPSRNYVITANGDKVFVTDLEGKTVGLYFMLSTYKKSADFTGTLVKVYNELKAKEENFEIVMIPLDDNEESFNKEFSGLPWLSLPFKDKKCEKLVRYFELLADAVEEHGVIAYPFTPDKFAELEKIEKAKQEAQTLESVLVSGDLDFVLGKDGAKGVALRGLFIIDKEGVIQHSTINNLAIGRSVDETMRTLQALQFVQENPDEVCPAGWKPGEKSMKPDPKLSKEYFAAI